MSEEQDSRLIQVKTTKTTQCFSFELPKGQLQKEHVRAFLDFIDGNETIHVMKSLLHIYFTARNDQFFKMTTDEMLCFERTLKLLADLSCKTFTD